jgi:hypothetical protein
MLSWGRDDGLEPPRKDCMELVADALGKQYSHGRTSTPCYLTVKEAATTIRWK